MLIRHKLLIANMNCRFHKSTTLRVCDLLICGLKDNFIFLTQIFDGSIWTRLNNNSLWLIQSRSIALIIVIVMFIVQEHIVVFRLFVEQECCLASTNHFEFLAAAVDNVKNAILISAQWKILCRGCLALRWCTRWVFIFRFIIYQNWISVAFSFIFNKLNLRHYPGLMRNLIQYLFVLFQMSLFYVILFFIA